MVKTNTPQLKPLVTVVLPDGDIGIVATVSSDGAEATILSKGEKLPGTEGADGLLSDQNKERIIAAAIEKQKWLKEQEAKNSDEALLKRYQDTKEGKG